MLPAVSSPQPLYKSPEVCFISLLLHAAKWTRRVWTLLYPGKVEEETEGKSNLPTPLSVCLLDWIIQIWAINYRSRVSRNDWGIGLWRLSFSLMARGKHSCHIKKSKPFCSTTSEPLSVSYLFPLCNDTLIVPQYSPDKWNYKGNVAHMKPLFKALIWYRGLTDFQRNVQIKSEQEMLMPICPIWLYAHWQHNNTVQYCRWSKSFFIPLYWPRIIWLIMWYVKYCTVYLFHRGNLAHSAMPSWCTILQINFSLWKQRLSCFTNASI